MKRALPYLPPLLLCAVALFQVHLVKAHGLTPWKGGGFGMFSTNDNEFRHTEVWVEGPEERRSIDVTGDYAVALIATYPSRERLTSMARRIGEVQRARGADVNRVRVAVWRRDFARETLEPRLVLVREVVVDIDSQ